jgi:hypothetical protein
MAIALVTVKNEGTQIMSVLVSIFERMLRKEKLVTVVCM